MDCWCRRIVSGFSTGGHLIPWVAHKRLVVSTPPPAFRLKNAVLLGELDRIYNRPRPHLGSVPTEDFLNSRPLVSFDDETKSIRAETQALLRRIHSPVPRSVRPPLILGSGTVAYQELPLTTRITSDDYIERMLDSYKCPNIAREVNTISHYNEPSRTSIGRGHLACVSYAGGRGYPRRKYLFRDENRDIRDEIKMRSYYDKTRMAAKERQAANLLPTGFASRLLRLTPEPEPKRRPIKPYRHTTSTPSEIKKKEEEAKAKELDDLEARIQKRKKEKEEAIANEVKSEATGKKGEEEKLAEQVRKSKARQLEEERQAEEAKRFEEARIAEEERKKIEEAKKLEEAKKKAEEEEAIKKAEEEAARKKAEEETKKKEEEEAKRKAEEAKRKAEEEAKRKAEEEAKRKAEEEAKRKAEEEAKKKAAEEDAKRIAAEEEAKRIAAEEEAKRIAAEEEAKRSVEDEMIKKAEEERLADEARLAEEQRLSEGANVEEIMTKTEEHELENPVQIISEEEKVQETTKVEESPIEESKLIVEDVSSPTEDYTIPKEEDVLTGVHSNDGKGETVQEPIVEEPLSPDAENAVAEILEGPGSPAEECEEE